MRNGSEKKHLAGNINVFHNSGQPFHGPYLLYHSEWKTVRRPANQLIYYLCAVVFLFLPHLHTLSQPADFTAVDSLNHPQSNVSDTLSNHSLLSRFLWNRYTSPPFPSCNPGLGNHACNDKLNGAQCLRAAPNHSRGRV